MVDKVTTIPRTEMEAQVGRPADEDMVRLNRAVLVFLGIAAPTSNEQVESPWLSEQTCGYAGLFSIGAEADA